MTGLDVVTGGGGTPPPAPDAEFLYDLGDPECYLVAERVRAELPVVCAWVPVHAASLGLPAGGAATDPDALAARVGAQGLLTLRLPARLPVDSALAARVATYAAGAGKSIAFSLAAFRQAFAAGRDLSEEATVLLAAASCEMHPAAVIKGAALRGTAAALERAHDRARALGVDALPAFRAGGVTVCGPGALERAAAAVA